MELKTIVLFQMLVCVTMATYEPFEDPVDFADYDEFEKGEDESELIEVPQLDPSNCQFKVIKKCNHQFKNIFQGKHRLTASSDRQLYCKGIQTFVDCLEATNCRGSFIDNYSYVILQHGMMDKKLNVCPRHSYDKLKTKVKAISLKHLFIDDIGHDRATSCSAAIHKKCVNTFTSSMKRNSNMCQDVQSFLDCYKKESPSCHAQITQHFSHLCNQLGEQMLKANEKHLGMMC